MEANLLFHEDYYLELACLFSKSQNFLENLLDDTLGEKMTDLEKTKTTKTTVSSFEIIEQSRVVRIRLPF